MLSGGVDNSDLDFGVVFRDDLSPASRSAAIAEFAREQLALAEQQNRAALGETPSHTTTVDGRDGASEDDVRPDGVIAYTFDLVPEVFSFIIEQLRTHAPVRSGRYRDSFELFADGVAVDPSGVVPKAGEYVFFSPEPYARKIEGAGLRPPESRQAPGGVFEAVAAIAADRFDGEAQVFFSFRPALDDHLLSSDQGQENAPAITVIPRI